MCLVAAALSLVLSIIPPPPSSTLFPYTTLFRSRALRPRFWDRHRRLQRGKLLRASPSPGQRTSGEGIENPVSTKHDSARQRFLAKQPHDVTYVRNVGLSLLVTLHHKNGRIAVRDCI